MRRSRQTTPAPRAATVVRLVALLAIFLQAFLVQTHVHPVGAAAASAYEQSARAEAHDDGAIASADDHQMSCAICEAYAANGRAALPRDPTLVAFDALTFETAAVAFAQAFPSPVHSWRSRAPPSFL